MNHEIEQLDAIAYRLAGKNEADSGLVAGIIYATLGAWATGALPILAEQVREFNRFHMLAVGMTPKDTGQSEP